MNAPIHFDLGISMLSVYDENGFLGIQYDAEGENDSGVQPYEVHPTNGCLHRPLDPDVDSSGIPSAGATVLIAMEAGRGHIIPLGDPRVIENLAPQIAKGETVLFNSFGAFYRQLKDGSHAIYTTTTGGGTDGQSISQWWTPTSRMYQAPWGTELWDASGWFIAHIGGAGITLGFAGGLVPGYGSYARLTGDIIDLDAAVISIGPTGVPKTPVVSAVRRAPIDAVNSAALAAIAASLSAIGAALTNLVSIPANVAAVGTVSAAATAIGAAATAITTAATALGATLPATATQTTIG